MDKDKGTDNTTTCIVLSIIIPLVVIGGAVAAYFVMNAEDPTGESDEDSEQEGSEASGSQEEGSAEAQAEA